MRSILTGTDALEAFDPAKVRLVRCPAGQLSLDSGTLFAGSDEVAIAQADEIYRLRLMRQNKPILNK